MKRPFLSRICNLQKQISVLVIATTLGPFVQPAQGAAYDDPGVMQRLLVAGIIRDVNMQYALASFEGLALSNFLTSQGMDPVADRNRLLYNRRDTAPAAVFGALVINALKPDASQTTEERRVKAALADLVQHRRIMAAETAWNEYLKWSYDYCAYRAPAGFTYDASVYCRHSLADLIKTNPPVPPFQRYGAAAAYGYLNQPAALQAAQAASASLLALSAPLAGIAGAAGGAAANFIAPAVAARVIRVFAPFVAFELVSVATSAFIASGPVAAIGLLVEGIVFQTLSIIKFNAIGGQLQNALQKAYAEPDLAALAADPSGNGLKEMMLAFMPITLFYENGTVVGDPGPVIEPTPNATVLDVELSGEQAVSSISYQTPDGAPHLAVVDRVWFWHETSPGQGRYDYIINYKDWRGSALTARVDSASGQFRIGSPGQPLLPTLALFYTGPYGGRGQIQHHGVPRIDTNSRHLLNQLNNDGVKLGSYDINYRTWDGTLWSATISGNTFRHFAKGQRIIYPSNEIRYTTFDGSQWTATLNGKTFTHTDIRTGQVVRSDRMDYLNWQGEKWSVRIE